MSSAAILTLHWQRTIVRVLVESSRLGNAKYFKLHGDLKGPAISHTEDLVLYQHI